MSWGQKLARNSRTCLEHCPQVGGLGEVSTLPQYRCVRSGGTPASIERSLSNACVLSHPNRPCRARGLATALLRRAQVSTAVFCSPTPAAFAESPHRSDTAAVCSGPAVARICPSSALATPLPCHSRSRGYGRTQCGRAGSSGPRCMPHLPPPQSTAGWCVFHQTILLLLLLLILLLLLLLLMLREPNCSEERFSWFVGLGGLPDASRVGHAERDGRPGPRICPRLPRGAPAPRPPGSRKTSTPRDGDSRTGRCESLTGRIGRRSPRG